MEFGEWIRCESLSDNVMAHLKEARQHDNEVRRTEAI